MKTPNSGTGRAVSWIHSPALDLIVGCGAWSAPLLLLSYSHLADSPAWSIGFYGLALFLNYPHYMATLYRAYHNQDDFQKYRIFTVHITGLVLLTAILSHFRFSLLPWIFTLYLTTSPWHYTGQNYGLFMMFARRTGAQIRENTRQAIYSAFVLSYAILFLNLHTGPSDRLFLSLGIPESPAEVARIILGAFSGVSKRDATVSSAVLVSAFKRLPMVAEQERARRHQLAAIVAVVLKTARNHDSDFYLIVPLFKWAILRPGSTDHIGNSPARALPQATCGCMPWGAAYRPAS